MKTPVLLTARFVARQALRRAVAETDRPHAVFWKTAIQENAPNRVRALRAQLLVVLAQFAVIAVSLDHEDQFRRREAGPEERERFDRVCAAPAREERATSDQSTNRAPRSSSGRLPNGARAAGRGLAKEPQARTEELPSVRSLSATSP